MADDLNRCAIHGCERTDTTPERIGHWSLHQIAYVCPKHIDLVRVRPVPDPQVKDTEDR